MDRGVRRDASFEMDITMRKSLGLIRLRALPAPDVWHARDTLSLYAVEPRSTVTVTLNAAGLRPGAVAGLALFSSTASGSGQGTGASRPTSSRPSGFHGRTHRPYAWFGVERGRRGFTLARCIEPDAAAQRMPLRDRLIWLRADCDFVRNEAAFHYSTDGRRFARLGEPHPIDTRPAAALSLSCSLFSCATEVQEEGGHAEFESFLVTTERG
jgi:xylan 1,4-beta-xylosidase